MCISQYKKKLFGVALDPADDPWSLQLKQEWMAADPTRLDWLSACRDPYDAVIGSMAVTLEKQGIDPAGKFPIPSWLWPKPNPADLPLVTVQNMGYFFDSSGSVEIRGKVQSYVRDEIFPDIPLMLGVDHSATAGVVSALAERYSPEKLNVVVLDQHFDAIPLSVRLRGATQANPGFVSGTPVGFRDQFSCGSFWSYLLDDGTILPQNLIFIGVADYPEQKEGAKKNIYQKAYLDFETRGCGFFPRQRFEGDYTDELYRFLRDKIKAPNLYISLDLDVGSFSSTYAARYMDRLGISKQNILDIAALITEQCRQGRYQIVGLDIMEFNMHFLGIETPDGIKDQTLALVEQFIIALT